MSAWPKLLRIAERGLLFLGLLLIAVFSLAYAHRFVMLHAAMTEFEIQKPEPSKEMQRSDPALRDQKDINAVSQAQKTRSSTRLVRRTKLSEAILGVSSKPLAVLRIPRLEMAVPVLEGTDEVTLNRGAGRIAGTAYPGEDGNIGIAGHRDGVFRPLKDIAPGDLVELVTTSGTVVYAVDRVRIARPSDVSALQPRTKPSLTLVTCYPFYFVGHAPERYVVEASLRQ